MLFGAAAQFGIFMTTFLAICTGQFDLKEAAAIGIIGAADGPTSIYVANTFKLKNLIGPISVAAYSYMSLVPVIHQNLDTLPNQFRSSRSVVSLTAPSYLIGTSITW